MDVILQSRRTITVIKECTMKTLAPSVAVIEVENEGLYSLLGQDIDIDTGVYIYAGRLVGVNNTYIKLENPHIVYETGDHAASRYARAEALHRPCQYVMISGIIAFGPTTRLAH
jgi:hypothetical protein